VAGGSLLSVSELSTAFLSDGVWRPAVADLSFALRPRETLAIVGESGSGKSVTALSLMRLLPAANSRIAGIALLEGRDLFTLEE
jgi:peptide/nickel transport system ATP-binding protein